MQITYVLKKAGLLKWKMQEWVKLMISLLGARPAELYISKSFSFSHYSPHLCYVNNSYFS